MDAKDKKEEPKKTITQQVKDQLHKRGNDKDSLTKFMSNPFVKKD